MPRRFICLFLVVFGLVAGHTALAADAFDLPADLQKLLPAEPAALVAVSSVNEMLDQVEAIMTTLDENEAPSRAELMTHFEDQVPRFSEMVDLDKPFVFAAGLPNLMAGGEPPLTYILPLRSDFADRDSIGTNPEIASHAFEGGYVAISSDPEYVPADMPPALAAHLAGGVISSTLDLEVVLLNFRPFIEMGLAGIPIRPAGASADSAAGFTAEEAAAMKSTISKVMDSATRLDMSLGRDDDLITWHTGLGVKPGSALDPGPQPDFARALALTAALPPNADFLQVLALDQSRMFEAFREYYIITMQNSLSGMGEEQAARYAAWVENYLTSMDLWSHPMASALRLDETGMMAHVIMESDDAEAAVAKLAEIMEGMNDLGIGYTLTELPEEKIAGAKFRAWEIDFDLEQFEAVMPQNQSPAMSGTARLQAEQMVSILRKIMPRIYLGAKDGKLYLASDRDTKALAGMIEKVGQGGPPVPAVAAVAAKAGPTCQQVISGDLLAIIKWVTELMEELDEQQRTLLASNPIPFEADVTIDGTDFGFDMGMDLASMGRLIKAIEEMDAFEDVGGDEAVIEEGVGQ